MRIADVRDDWVLERMVAHNLNKGSDYQTWVKQLQLYTEWVIERASDAVSPRDCERAAFPLSFLANDLGISATESTAARDAYRKVS